MATRDNPQEAPKNEIFGGAVTAEQTAAAFEDRINRTGCRVLSRSGCHGKEKGRLKTDSQNTILSR